MKRKEETVVMPLSIMIDITFLLLMFFIVTAAAQSDAIDREVTLAKSTYTEPPETANLSQIILNVKLRPDGEAEYTISGNQFRLQELGRVIADARGSDGDMTVVIRADGRMKYKEIQKITKVLGDVGIWRVAHASESEWQQPR